MITYTKGNIFESDADALVNPVNTVGVMGKGLALEFKKRFPEMFKSYRFYCTHMNYKIGELMIYTGCKPAIINFPTKTHYKMPSKIEYIEEGLKSFCSCYEERGIKSVAFPKLGCGLGGLNWEKEVKPLMEKYLQGLPIEVYIYE